MLLKIIKKYNNNSFYYIIKVNIYECIIYLNKTDIIIITNNTKIIYNFVHALLFHVLSKHNQILLLAYRVSE